MRRILQEEDELSVRKRCELLGVNRSTLYYQRRGESPENLELMNLLDKRHLSHPTHGVLQIQDHLRFLLIFVNVKRIRRLLRLMGVIAHYPSRNLSRLGHAKYVRPYLLRNLAITANNQVWAVDITYIPMAHGFMYLTAIIDIHSRYVVGWDVHNTLDASHCLNVLRGAIKRHGTPGIINSDQGSQFTCQEWIDYLQEEGITVSMDGKGRATDNIFIERFWRTVKQDYVYLHPAADALELYHGLQKFINFYNHEKTHQGIGRVPPATLYLKAE